MLEELDVFGSGVHDEVLFEEEERFILPVEDVIKEGSVK